MSSPTVSEAMLIFIVGELIYLSYKMGKLEARVRNLENLIKHVLNEKQGGK
ncbi:MAG: hypothetical protein QXT28_12025 [Thermofilaceae archaeon]